MSSDDARHGKKDLCMKCHSHASNSVSGTPAWGITSTLKAVFHTLTISTWHYFLTSVHSKVHYQIRVLNNQSSLQGSVRCLLKCMSVNEWHTCIVTLINSLNTFMCHFVVAIVAFYFCGHRGILFWWAKIWSSQVLSLSNCHMLNHSFKT